MAPDTTVVLTRFHCPFVTKHPRAPLRDTGASGSWSSPRKQRVSRPPRRRTPWLQPSETTFGVWSSYLPKMHLCRFKSAPGIIAAARDWNTSNEKSRKVLGSSGKWATPRTPEPLLAREPPPGHSRSASCWETSSWSPNTYTSTCGRVSRAQWGLGRLWSSISPRGPLSPLQTRKQATQMHKQAQVKRKASCWLVLFQPLPRCICLNFFSTMGCEEGEGAALATHSLWGRVIWSQLLFTEVAFH